MLLLQLEELGDADRAQRLHFILRLVQQRLHASNLLGRGV
jgi:hypothetical protein